MMRLFMIGILTILAFSACENSVKEIKKLNATHDLTMETGKKINGFMSTDAKMQANLIADYMKRSEADSEVTEFPKKLIVILYNDTAKADSHISADYGRYVKRSNMIYLRGHVLIYNIKKDTLKTEELYFDQNKNIIYTSTPVWFQSIQPNQQRIYAKKGMWANSKDLRNYTFYDAVPISYLEYSEMSLNAH